MRPKTVTQWLADIGRKGGSRKSLVKAVSSRENGKAGGRPRRPTCPHGHRTEDYPCPTCKSEAEIEIGDLSEPQGD